MEDSDPEEYHDVESPGDGGSRDKAAQSESEKETKPVINLDDDDENLGFTVVAAMSEADMDEFITRLDAAVPAMDHVSVNQRVKKLDWSSVAFGGYSADECKAAWEYLKTLTRKYRIMSEVVREIKLITEKQSGKFRAKLIESAPGFPKKPPNNGSQMFVREMWNMNPEKKNFIMFQKEAQDKYNGLTNSIQLDWEKKCELLKAEHNRKVKEFYSNYPHYSAFVKSKKTGTFIKQGRPKIRIAPRPVTRLSKDAISIMYSDAPPIPLPPKIEFIQSKLNRMDPPPDAAQLPELKQKYKEKWQNLSDKKKSKWIGKVIKRCGDYLQEMECFQIIHPEFVPKPFKFRAYLTKDELALWESFRGKPEKPPTNVFDMFCANLMQDPEFSDLSHDECRRIAEDKFKHLDNYNRDMYKLNFRKAVIDYRKNITAYFDELPEYLRAFVLPTIPKKFHCSVTNVDKTLDDSDDEDQPEYDPSKDTITEVVEEVAEASSPPKKKKKKKQRNEETEDEELKEEPVTPKKKKRESRILENEESEPEEIIHEPVTPRKKRKRRHEDTSAAEDTDATENGVPSPKLDRYGRRIDPTIPPVIPKGQDIQYNTKVRKYPKKPTLDEFPPERVPVKMELNDIIRGIFDARQHVGRTYSIWYFYGKYVGSEKTWVDRVDKDGLVKTAKLIYTTFLKLSNLQKATFITSSFTFYRELSIQNPQQNRKKHIAKRLYPGEPVPPHKTAHALYDAEMKLVKRRYPELLIPRWHDLEDKIQNLYMKKLFRNTKNYVKAYQEFVNNMNPNDMLMYTAFSAECWEYQNHLHDTAARALCQSYVFPLPGGDLSEDEDVEAEDSDPEIIDNMTYLERMSLRKRNQREPSKNLLNNDGLIEAITKRVRREEPTIPEILEDSSSDGSNDPTDSEAEETCFKFGDPQSLLGCRVYTRRIRKLCRRKKKYIYDLDEIPNPSEIPKPKPPIQRPKGWSLKKLRKAQKLHEFSTQNSCYRRNKKLFEKHKAEILADLARNPPTAPKSVTVTQSAEPENSEMDVILDENPHDPISPPPPEQDEDQNDYNYNYTERADELFDLLPSPTMLEPKEDEDLTQDPLDPSGTSPDFHNSEPFQFTQPTLQLVTGEDSQPAPEDEEYNIYHDMQSFEQAEADVDAEQADDDDDDGEDPYK